MQTLDLLPAAVGQVLSLVVHGGEQQLGVCQQGMRPLQVSPQLLLHIKVSVAHLKMMRPLPLTPPLMALFYLSYSLLWALEKT